MTNETLPDAFAPAGDGYPGLSFVSVREGDKVVKAVILPQQTDRGEVAYTSVQQTKENEQTKEQEPLFWQDGKPRMQAVILLSVPGIGVDDYLSRPMLDRLKALRAEDGDLPSLVKEFGLRKLYVSGASIPAGLRKALAAKGIGDQRRLPIGGMISLRFDGDHANPKGQGRIKDFTVRFDLPTDESRALVVKFKNALLSDDNTSVDDADDPWTE